MKNRIPPSIQDTGNEVDIGNIKDIIQGKETRILNIDSISRMVYHLSGDERMRLIDLNTIFYEQIIKMYTYEFVHAWVEYNAQGIYNIEELIRRYCNNITSINIVYQIDIDLNPEVMELCNNISHLKIEEGDVNELLCLAYSKWANKIKSINIGEQNEDYLQQVPKFPKLEELILSNIKVSLQYFNELFFFVPETITTLHLTELDCLDSNVVAMIMDKFINLKNLNLNSNRCNEEVLTCLNTKFKKLKELSLGEIQQLSKAHSKLKLLAKNIPNLKVLKIYGKDDLQEEENRLPLLLNDNVYPMSTICLVNMNMNVEYKFLINKFPNLTKLNLDSCANITHDKFTIILQNLNLTLLSMDESNITDDHFKVAGYNIKQNQFQSNIKVLSLSQNFPLGHNLLQFIFGYMPQLETLDVSYSKAGKFNLLDTFSEQYVNHNIKLKIKQMKIKNSFINGNTLEMMIKFCPQLESLYVEDYQEVIKYLDSKGLLRKELIIANDSD